MKHTVRVFLLVAWVLAPLAHGDERYVAVALESAQLQPAASTSFADEELRTHWHWQDASALQPYATLDGAGEVYLEYEQTVGWEAQARIPARIVVRTEAAGDIAGTVYLIKPDLSGLAPHRFKLSHTGDDPSAKSAFAAAMEVHYQGLLDRDLPGAAWFRHRLNVARALRGLAIERNDANPAGLSMGRTITLDDTLDLFTGERALAENLDLDRGLRGLKDEQPTLDIATLEGVTTRAIDWKGLVKDLEPERDALAASIPADQHGVFFPSFDALVRVLDEVDRAGTPILHFASAHAEDQRTKERYQEQLCLPLSAIARTLGPAIVASVAITGSDPFLPSGSDLALLFECKQPAVLEEYLRLRHLDAKSKGAQAVEGAAGDLRYTGVRSADRRVSSYVARFDGTIVVANSIPALERIAATHSGRSPALASTDEYTWFRDRYKKGDAHESALVVLSDATIRRWASPRERIGNSRRVRAAAAMAEIQAQHLDAIVKGTLAPGASAADPDLPFSSDFVWSQTGVASPTWGSLAFLTPLSEVRVERVTASEKAAYEAFRRNFQNLWSTVFDPIALRLDCSDAKLALDLTVMPLAVTTEYRQWMDLTRGAALATTSGDAHADTLFHCAFAFASNSGLGRMFTSGVGPFAQQLGTDPLGWIGGGVALYGDRDEFWGEMSRAPDRSTFLEKNFYRLPLALHVEVKDGLKLAAFLTALRATADGAAPGLTHWETKTWHEQPYVRIAVEEGVDEMADKAALYYAAMPNAFVLSLREDVVQHAIERRLARKAGTAIAAQPWLGSSLGLRVERDAVDLVSGVSSIASGDVLRRVAWSALPILDEWKRLYPNVDPVVLHERLWGVRLESPGGGSFVWNDALQTMEASDYGCPAAPRAGPVLPRALDRFTRGEFGLSFEGEGLRARAEVERDDKK